MLALTLHLTLAYYCPPDTEWDGALILLCSHPNLLLSTHRLGGLQSSDLNRLPQRQTKSNILFTCCWDKPYPDQTNTLGHSTLKLKLAGPGDYRHQNLVSSNCSCISVCTTSVSAAIQYQKKTTTKKCAVSLTASTLLQQISPRVKQDQVPIFSCTELG